MPAYTSVNALLAACQHLSGYAQRLAPTATSHCCRERSAHDLHAPGRIRQHACVRVAPHPFQQQAQLGASATGTLTPI